MIIRTEATDNLNNTNVRFVIKLNYTEAVGLAKGYTYYQSVLQDELSKLIVEAK